MSSIKLSRNPSENSIEFLVTRGANWTESNKAIISENYTIGSIKFQLKIRFSKSKTLPTLLILECQRGTLFYQGALIELTVGCFYNSIIVDQKKSLIRTLLLSNASWDLGEYNTFSWIRASKTNLRLTFKYTFPFDLDSCLAHSFTSPSKTPFFRYLNNKEASDICFQLKTNKQELWVRKDIITFECPFFQKTVLGDWENKLEGKLISPPCSDKIFLICILHLYTGWLPGSSICPEVFQRLKVDKSELKLDTANLSELYEVAKLLELPSLAYFTLKQLEEMAKQQQASLISYISKLSLTA
ncbi:hypothetical protein HMI54_011001 [Coelomomyces lativittatus]|nr:hypothetical protein HMI54_011001 [Coelomomyces lativittatus]KAJ1511812.1 hypothetical protein HMI56_004924 [Coelomomyces lativittatus]